MVQYMQAGGSRLAASAEAEAQQYLDERGFEDRQVRAWGDTNSERNLALPRVGAGRSAGVPRWTTM